MDQHTQTSREDMVLSYHRVRTALGVVGLLLPVVLIVLSLLAEGKIHTSFSDFFHSLMRDVYVGGLCAIGVFLVSYRGYRRASGEWLSDDLIATVAGISAFLVAFFPNQHPGGEVETVAQLAVGMQFSPVLHYVAALTFFLCLSLFCYVKFPKTAKPGRRRIYIWSGHMIWVAGLSIIATSYFKQNGTPAQSDFVVRNNLIFWAEAMGVWVFAIAWLTKGKADMLLIRTARRKVQTR